MDHHYHRRRRRRRRHYRWRLSGCKRFTLGRPTSSWHVLQSDATRNLTKTQ